MADTRQVLTRRALAVAVKLGKRNGVVTAPGVMRELAKDARTAALMATVDPRWIGGVFRSREFPFLARTWVQYPGCASHDRPVRVWEYTGVRHGK